jgi:hypothetical protein
MPHPSKKADSFITSPNIDAYEPWEVRSWRQFVSLMVRQANGWGTQVIAQGYRKKASHYPAIGWFNGQRFAIQLPTGKSSFSTITSKHLIQFEWPQNWNVT